MFDYLVVGAGFAGAVLAERLANGLGKKVLLYDKRSHIGGNAYDFYNDDGILIHKYGPHIFHTNSAEVFDYLSQFTKWREYQHRPLVRYGAFAVAAAVSLSRYSGRNHFLSDIVVGSAIGFGIGRVVYLRRHIVKPKKTKTCG